MKLKYLTFAIALTMPVVAQAQSQYSQENFVANKESYKPTLMVDKDLVNAWGISIRPQGAGGHFWVTAGNKSFEYVGDVRESKDKKLQKLHQDDYPVMIAPVGGKDNVATGTIFSGSQDGFIITQKIEGKSDITAPAKFMFASDGGIISAWTERKLEDGHFDRPKDAITVIDYSKQGSQFFGLAIANDYSKIYAADFGVKPAIHVFGKDFKAVDIKFDMPFDENKNGKVDAGEYAPFNIQNLTTPKGENHIFVAYAKTQACPDEEVKNGNCKAGDIFAGEEDTEEKGAGRIAEFTEEGKLVATWDGGTSLSAPWGMAFAPKNFGDLSQKLLVTNFGDGTIVAFDENSKKFTNYMKNEKNENIVIDGIWGIIFGNGDSLGDKDALYFAAGPVDETDGIFGAIRLKK